MQFFVKPGEEIKWYEHWKEKRMKWHKTLGLGAENFIVSTITSILHTTPIAACDIQFNFPMGFREFGGNSLTH